MKANDSLKHKTLALIVAYFTLQLILRVWLRLPGLHNDESEVAYLARQFQWLYPRQLPLYNWIQYGLFQIFGYNLFSIALLKQILLCLATSFYFLTCCRLCRTIELAFCALLSWVWLHQLSWHMQFDQTHNALALCFCSICLYLLTDFHLSKKTYNTAQLLVLSFMLTLTMLTKYNAAIFVLLFLGAAMYCCHGKNLERYKAYRLMLFSTLVLVLPLIYLFIKNYSTVAPTTYKLASPFSTDLLFNPLVSLLLFCLSLFIILTLVFWRKRNSLFKQLLPSAHPKGSLPQIMAVYLMVVLLLIGLLSLILLGKVTFRSQYFSPLLFFLPILLFTHPNLSKSQLSQYLKISAVAVLLITTALFVSDHCANRQMGFPAKQVAKAIKPYLRPSDNLYGAKEWPMGMLCLYLDIPNRCFLNKDKPANQPGLTVFTAYKPIKAKGLIPAITIDNTGFGFKSQKTLYVYLKRIK